jgi:MFS superfamily sulfate permease-like transporter
MFSFKFWRQDLQSSLVVFLVALPLCLGIALASNAPLSSGLYAGIIGGIVVGAFSGSAISVSGPAAGLTVIVVTAIASLGSFEAFTVAVFLSGLIQIIFGMLRGGAIGDYFPTSVIKGMLVAIGLILILKQLPHAIGYDVDFMGDESFQQGDGENTFTELLLAFKWLHPGASLIAFISLLVIILWEKKAMKGGAFFKLFPGALAAVILGVTINELFKMGMPAFVVENSHLVQLPFAGGWGDFVQGIKTPNWSYLTNPTVYRVALTIAIVGSLESLLSIDAADKMEDSGKVTSKNRELFAQGMANSLSGFVGGLPVTAVIVRTTANASAGGKTQLSAILHGIWLMICVVTIPQVLNLIPLSSLAAILLLVGYKLAKPLVFKYMWSKGPNQFIPFIATIIAILFTDLLVGIMIGIVVGFIFVIRSNMHQSIVLVQDGNCFLIRFYKDVSFMKKSALLKILNEIPDNADLVIDGSKGVFVDHDILEMIEDFMKAAPERNIKVYLQKSTLALSKLFKEEIHG